MGKYPYECPNPFSEEIERKVEEFNHIANELAEANRLKRIELESHQHQFIDPKQWVKELEDQA